MNIKTLKLIDGLLEENEAAAMERCLKEAECFLSGMSVGAAVARLIVWLLMLVFKAVWATPHKC